MTTLQKIRIDRKFDVVIASVRKASADSQRVMMKSALGDIEHVADRIRDQEAGLAIMLDDAVRDICGVAPQ